MRTIVMLGPSTHGGIATAISTYREHGFFSKWHIEYLTSYAGPGIPTQLRVMALVLGRLISRLLRCEVALLHVHSASRGSFWRKSLLCATADIFAVPYIFHVHSGEFGVFYETECGRFGKWWVRRTLRRAAGVIALGETWRTVLLSIEPQSKAYVIGNPVDVPTALPEDAKEPREVVFLGRLREKKGIFDLVRAIPMVLESVPGAVFTLAGDGDLDTVRRLAQDLGVSDAVKLPGWLAGAEKEAALSAAHALVLPSYFEGQPVCLLEAMAQGIPIVSTRIGGIPELLQSGECGLLVQPGDVEALSRALVSLLREGELRRGLRNSAFRRAVDYYSITAVLNSLDGLYRGLIGSDIELEKGM